MAGMKASGAGWSVETVVLDCVSDHQVATRSNGILGRSVPVGNGPQFLVKGPGRVFFVATMPEVEGILSAHHVGMAELTEVTRWK